MNYAECPKCGWILGDRNHPMGECPPKRLDVVPKAKPGKLTHCTKTEFSNYIKNHYNLLNKEMSDCYHGCLVTYNDFTLGDYPDSIVASYKWIYDECKAIDFKILKG